jgi:hypothetical protein
MQQGSAPAKEGIVLDREDQPVFPSQSAPGGAGMRVRVYRGGWWLPIALGVGIPLLFVAGIFIFTLLMTLGIAFVLLRSLFGSRSPSPSRH